MAGVSARDRDAIIRTLIGEAQDQPPQGQAGVVHVILKRTGNPEFGMTPYDVVHQRGAFEPWARNGGRLRAIRPDSPQYQDAAKIVDGVLSGAIPDPTGGSNYFYAPTLQRQLGRATPGWARGKTPSNVIGGHAFYNMPKDWLNEWDKAAPTAAAKSAAQAPASGASRDWLSEWDGGGETKTAKEAETPKLTGNLDLPYTDPGTSSAFAGGFTRGIPVIGPYLDEGAKHAAAAIRSAIYKTPFHEELKAVNDYAEQTAKARPVAEGLGELGGGVTGLAVGGLAAPTAMGLSGPLLTRMAAGSMSGMGINALDAAVRSGGDPYQTALGAGVGGVFGLGSPLVAKGVGAGARKLLGMSGTAQDYLLQKATDLGIPIRPSQTSTSGFVKKLDQMAGQLPGGAGGKDAANQNAAVIGAAAREFGAKDFSQAEMSAARSRLSDAFEDVKPRMTAAHDLPFQDTMNSVLDDAKLIEAPARERVENLVNHVVSHFEQDGSMPGELFHSLTKKGSTLDRAAKTENSDVRYAATQLRDALDSSAIRWSDPEDSAKFAATKLAWKNMKTVEPLANKPFTIAGLRQQVNSSFKDRAYTGTGKSALGDIVEIGEQYMQQPRDSGTPIGNFAIGALSHVPNIAGALLAGGAAHEAGASPLETVGAGALGLAGTAGMAKLTRTILNNPALLSGVLQPASGILQAGAARSGAPAVRNALTLDVNPRPGYFQDQPQQ